MAKFDGLKPRRCEDLKGIVAPEIGLKIVGTLEREALVGQQTHASVRGTQFRGLGASGSSTSRPREKMIYITFQNASKFLHGRTLPLTLSCMIFQNVFNLN